MTLLFTSGATKYIFYICVLNHVLLYSCEKHDDIEAMDPILGSFRYVQTVDHDALESLKNSETLSVVYYSHAVDVSTRDSFLQAFDDSAKYLEAYNIVLAMFNCMTNTLPIEECKAENSGKNVITYLNSVELIRLEMDTMFDINSIMSNSLQLLLLQEVPIIESQSERENLERSLSGQQDLFFFYTQAIGTLEHRVYMEIAYTYQDRYKFAISTKLESTMGLQDHTSLSPNADFALWTLYCSKASSEGEANNNFPNVLYRGGLTLSALADYMKQLPEPNLFFAPENGTSSLFGMESYLPVIFICTNNEMVKHSDDISNSLSYDVRGFAKIVVVNVDDEECLKVAMSQGFDGHIPEVAVATPDGKITFMEQRDELNLLDIRHFLTNVATIPTKPGEEVINATDPSQAEGEDDNGVEEQDDEVAKAVFGEEMEINHLPAVLKSTFNEFVTSSHLRMVLYYLPYDSVSVAFLSSFEAAAKILTTGSTTQDILARVNCFDASDLCARENVTTYPVIRIHKRDMPYQPYEGHLDTDSVVKAVGLLKHGFPQMLENENQLHKFVTGVFPTKITDLSPSSVVFVARKEDKGTWAVFRTASKHLTPFVAMAEAHENLVDLIGKKYQSSIPCVVSVHHNDTIQPIRTLSNIVDVNGVVNFVKQSMVPTMPKLTVVNFPVLRAKNRPFVILFLNQSEPTSVEIRSTVTNIGLMDVFKDSIFCWMDVQNETLGMKLLSEYTETISLPTITVVDHAQAKVFTQQAEAFTPTQITQWLTNVFNGKEQPSKTLEEREWSPPGSYYNFLTMIDTEEEQEQTGIDQERKEQTGDKIYDSGYKVGLENEEEVREKLLEQYRSNQNVDDETDNSEEQESDDDETDNSEEQESDDDETDNSEEQESDDGETVEEDENVFKPDHDHTEL